MRTPVLPICYYPSTAIAVDDNQTFLNIVALKLRRTIPCQTFSSERDALAYIEGLGGQYFSGRLADPGAQGSGDDSLVSEKQIHRQVLQAERYNEVSLVIVDYAMIAMNGVEFCEKIKGFKVPKIMLTAEASEVIATEAFNKGLIQAYIKKSEQELPTMLSQKVAELQKQYFLDHSREVIGLLANKDHLPISKCFFDHQFADFFYGLLEQHNIVEFYLYSTPGNFLLVDAKGNMSWLVVGTDQELDEEMDWAIDQYEDCEDPSAKYLIDEIKRKERILFFPVFHEGQSHLPFSEWHKIAKTCQQVTLENGNRYYYALFSDDPVYTLGEGDRLSLQDFMARHRQ